MSAYLVVGWNHPDKFAPGEREELGMPAWRPAVALSHHDKEWQAAERVAILRAGPVGRFYESFSVFEELDE